MFNAPFNGTNLKAFGVRQKKKKKKKRSLLQVGCPEGESLQAGT